MADIQNANRFKVFRASYIWIAVILGVGTLLRVYHLDYQSLWVDEIHSMNGADPDYSLLEVIEYSKKDQPPTFFLILHFWLKLFGFSDISGRSLSVVIGVLGILAMYFLGDEIKGERIGLMSSFITSINYFHISFSQEARFYSLLFLLAALSYLFFIRAIKKNKYIDFVLYFVFTVGMLYTHYFGLVVFASQAAIFLGLIVWNNLKRELILTGILTAFFTSLTLLPWISTLLLDASTDEFWIQLEPFYVPLKYFYVYFKDIVSCLVFGVFGLISFRVIYREYMVDKVNASAVILIGWIMLGFLIPMIYSWLVMPMITPRYTIIVLPAIIVMIALGIDSSLKSELKLLTLFLAISLSTILTLRSQFYHKTRSEQWREVSAAVLKQSSSTDIFVSSYNWYFNYYFKSSGSTKRVVLPQAIYDMGITNLKSVWLMEAFDKTSDGAFKEEGALLSNGFKRSKEVVFERAKAKLYVKD
jgi:mannosyltransferase